MAGNLPARNLKCDPEVVGKILDYLYCGNKQTVGEPGAESYYKIGKQQQSQTNAHKTIHIIVSYLQKSGVRRLIRKTFLRRKPACLLSLFEDCVYRT
jgi:hypothetical protein